MKKSLGVVFLGMVILAFGVLFYTEDNEVNAVFFVPNSGEGTISVIDSKSEEVVDTIVLDTNQLSHGIAVSPDGNIIYSGTGFKGKSLIIIDAKSKKTIKEVSFNEGVHGIDISPDGKVVYISLIPGLGEVGGGLAIVDAVKMEVINIVDTNGGPAHVAVRSDGSQVWVANVNGNTVAVIDAKENTLIKTIDVGNVPNEVALTPDGNWAFVANVESDNLSMIDTNSLQVVKVIPAGDAPHGVTISPNGSEVWVANNNSNDVTVFDIETLEPVNTIPTGSYANHVAFSLDGKLAYVTNRQSNDIVKIDAITKEILTRIKVGVEPHEISLEDYYPVNSEKNISRVNKTLLSSNSLQDSTTENNNLELAKPLGERTRKDVVSSVEVEVQLLHSTDLNSEYYVPDYVKTADFEKYEIFQFFLTTHSGDLSSLPISENTFLIVNGERIAPTNWIIASNDSHHPNYLAYFPKQKKQQFQLEIGAIGKDKVLFEW